MALYERRDARVDANDPRYVERQSASGVGVVLLFVAVVIAAFLIAILYPDSDGRIPSVKTVAPTPSPSTSPAVPTPNPTTEQRPTRAPIQ